MVVEFEKTILNLIYKADHHGYLKFMYQNIAICISRISFPQV
jgi:hypothetical protein